MSRTTKPGQATGGMRKAHRIRERVPRARDATPPRVQPGDAGTLAIVDHARGNRVTDEQIDAAKSYEERGLFCLRVLSLGLWRETERRLQERWNISEGSLYNYRRTGKVALAAVGDEHAPQRLEQTLASLRLQADRHEELAAEARAANRPTLAIKHDDLQRRSTMAFAEVAGLTERRVSISLEMDPRLAGLWPVLHTALEDFDRTQEERARALAAFVAEVEKLTGGPLPASVTALVAPHRSAHAHVRDAVHRYEAEIGARKLAA